MKIITDSKLYRELIPQDTPLYLQPAWMDLFSNNWNAKIGLNAEKQPIWLWPYHEKSRYGVKKIDRLPFCPDNGPIYLGVGTQNSFDLGKGRFFSKTVLDDRRNILEEDGLINSGWYQKDRFYQFFNIKSYPSDFQAVSRSKRKRMKKNSNLDFIRFDDLDDVGPLFLSSFHSMGQMNIVSSDLEGWKQSLDKSFDHYLFGLKDSNGNILSTQWLVGYQETLYGWQAVRHPLFPDAGARELLLWHILQWAKEYYQVYDLGGSSIPGVRQFNLEMGAEEVKYHRYVRYRPGWMEKVNR